jgi:hypothetical protein
MPKLLLTLPKDTTPSSIRAARQPLTLEEVEQLRARDPTKPSSMRPLEVRQSYKTGLLPEP